MVTARSNKMPLYFFFHGDLHKRLHINRAADQIKCWSFPGDRLITYNYTDIKRNYERAFSTKEVCKLVMRGRTTVELAIIEGNINPPPKARHLTGSGREFMYLWHEKNIMELHGYLSTVHRGRPRKDGFVTTQKMPTARELRAMIRQNLVHYVQGEDGEFVPTWDAKF